MMSASSQYDIVATVHNINILNSTYTSTNILEIPISTTNLKCKVKK